jgi:hypothetical protein
LTHPPQGLFRSHRTFFSLHRLQLRLLRVAAKLPWSPSAIVEIWLEQPEAKLRSGDYYQLYGHQKAEDARDASIG